jgi:NAD kinase
MSDFAYHKVVIVTRKTMLDELIERHGTRSQAEFYLTNRGQAFSDIQNAHDLYTTALASLRDAVPDAVRMQVIDRGFLPTFLFGPHDLVVTLGQDGLVVNTAKYLDGQVIAAFNPDPGRIDGVLVPFRMQKARDALAGALRQQFPVRQISMARAQLEDGQSLHAVNDLFVGIRSHISARYTLTFDGCTEDQSSSGIIISTGAGSTGWFRSIITGTAAIANAWVGGAAVQNLEKIYQFPPESRELRFSVREPFVSRTSSAQIVCGSIFENQSLEIRSAMPQSGVIFSDGIESDFVKFESGMRATIQLAEKKVNLAWPG